MWASDLSRPEMENSQDYDERPDELGQDEHGQKAAGRIEGFGTYRLAVAAAGPSGPPRPECSECLGLLLCRGKQSFFVREERVQREERV